MCAGCAAAARPSVPLHLSAVRVLYWICSVFVRDVFGTAEGVPLKYSLETDRDPNRDSDRVSNGDGATENSLTQPTAVQKRSWGQIKKERAQ